MDGRRWGWLWSGLALESDLLHGRILLADDRPELAETVLRAALDEVPESARPPLEQALAEALERLGRA